MNRWTWIYLQLIVMMLVLMAVSFLPEYFHDFFGDWKCDGSGQIVGEHYPYHYAKCNYADRGYHDPTWHWGYRHWILTLFGALFCIVNIIRLIDTWERRPE